MHRIGAILFGDIPTVQSLNGKRLTQKIILNVREVIIKTSGVFLSHSHVFFI